MLLTRVLLLLVGLASSGIAPAANGDVTLRRVPQGGIQPQAIRDAGGVIHLLYFVGEPAAGDLYYVRSSDDGATFSKPIRANSEPGSAVAGGSIRGGQLAIGPKGQAHVVWNGSAKSRTAGPKDPVSGRTGAQMFYARLNDAGTAFEPQRGLMQHTVNLDGGGSVAADLLGNVYVAWHANDARVSGRSEGDRVVWIARSADGGRTFAAETRAWTEATGACGCCGLHLFADGDALFLLYRSATAGGTQRDIFFLGSTDHGRSFTGTRVHPWRINACPMTSMSLAAGRQLFGAWETEGNVFFATLDRSAHRAIDVIEAPALKGPAKHPRIAVNAKGQALLAWTEGTGHTHGGALAWQLFDAQGRPAKVSGRSEGLPAYSFASVVARRDGGFVVIY
jgi:hypothetical protein